LLEGLVHEHLERGELGKARHQIFQMAEVASTAGNHTEAERLYREILAYQPADVDIRLRLSQEMAHLGELERAREGMLVLAGRFQREGNATSVADIYSRMLEHDGNNLNARFRLGSLWAEQGQTAQALEQFSQLAKVYLEQNLPEVAQRVLKRILELDPKDIEHRKQSIRLLIRNLRFDEATEHYRVLMGIHLERGEVDEALECVREITNLQPLNLELRQQLGAMFLRAGFLEQGQKLLESLAGDCKEKRDHERLFKVLWTLADSFAANEQWETSLEYRERVADLHRDTDNWGQAQNEYLSILEGYLSHGQREPVNGVFVKLVDGFFRYRVVAEGLELLNGLHERLEGSGRTSMALVIKERTAAIFEKLDQWDEAIEQLEQISERYLEIGDVDLALEFLRRAADQALAHDRTDHGIETLFKLSSRLVEFRDLSAARPVLDELLRTAQDNVPFLERVGDVLFQQGLFEEARPIYHEVLEKEPGRSQSLSRVAIIYAKEGRLEDASHLARQILAKGLVGKFLSEYEQVTGFIAGDSGSHMRRGKLYQKMGFIEEAILEYRRSAHDPNRILQAYNQMALCFEQQGYRELASLQLQKALDLPGYQEEDLLEIRFNLACALEEDGRYKEAMQAFQECYVVDIRYRDVAQRIEALSQKMQEPIQ
jgi:tetratricopeptide (TPR) repeat protein